MFAPTIIGGEHAPLPQANNLGAVAAVVDAVAEGCDTAAEIADAIGMANRQGGYYPNAAATLDLIVQVAGTHPTRWRLTDAGLTFVELDAAGRAAALAAAIVAYGQVQTYRDGGADELEKAYLLDGLADSTARRRVSTIGTWSQWATTAFAGGADREVGEASAATRLRAPQILAARKAAERRVALPTPQMCPRCHVQLAASGACNIC
jgi:hypothetical protein